MGNRTTAVHKFRTRLGFKQYNVILTKEQSLQTNDYDDRDFENEIKRQKAVEVKPCCEFIRTDPDKEDFDTQTKTINIKRTCDNISIL